MNAFVSWATWIVGTLLLGIACNLISNQLEAWLPLIARALLRRHAAKMGERAARCEEEWLADLEATAGGLLKLISAIKTCWVSQRTSDPSWEEDFEEISDRRLAAIVRNWAFMLGLLAIALFCFAFPPHPQRHAAYGLVIPLLVACSAFLAPHVRRAVFYSYDALAYTARVLAGGAIVPTIGFLALVATLLPPQGDERLRAPDEARTANLRFELVSIDEVPELHGRNAPTVERGLATDAVSQVRRVEERPSSTSPPLADFLSHDGIEHLFVTSLSAPVAPGASPPLIRSRVLPIVLVLAAPAIGAMNVYSLVETDLAKQPVSIDPERPSPPPTAPSAPTGVRITSAS